MRCPAMIPLLLCITISLVTAPVVAQDRRGRIRPSTPLVAVPLPGALQEPRETVLLDFYGEWCPLCHEMTPIIQELINRGHPVRKINIDHDKITPAKYGVIPIPCFIMLVNGKEVDRVVGKTALSRLEQMCKLGNLPIPFPEPDDTERYTPLPPKEEEPKLSPPPPRPRPKPEVEPSMNDKTITRMDKAITKAKADGVKLKQIVTESESTLKLRTDAMGNGKLRVPHE